MPSASAPVPLRPRRRATLAAAAVALAGSCFERHGLRSLEVTAPAASVAAGETLQLAATGTNENGSTVELTPWVAWTSDDEDVATVDTAGLVTALAEGACTVTATEPLTGRWGSAQIVVDPAFLASLALTPPAPQIALGTSVQITATGTFSDLTVQDLTDALEWSSSSSAVAPVLGGLAQGLGIGSATVSARDAATGVEGSTELTVTSAALVAIDVTPAAPSIALGTSQALVATGRYTDDTTQDLTDAVTWSASVAGVVTLDGAGTATGVGLGATAIVATDPASSIAGSTALTVTAAELVSIAVTPTAPSIALGTAQAFTATGTYTDGTNQDLTDGVTWSSSAPAVATMDGAPRSEGVATSASTGSTTVRASDAASGISGSTTLTVTDAELVSLAVTPEAPSIALGTDQAFTAMGTFTDASVQDLTGDVTWTSSDPGVATISNASGSEGLATSASTGSTTITATHAATRIDDATTLTVTPAVLVSLAVTPEAPSIALGTDQAFIATGTYSDGSVQDLTDAVTWTSSDDGVATISNAGGSEGLASSAAVGSATITATDPVSGIDDATTLTVTPAELVSIAVAPEDPSIALGTDQGFTATGTYTDGSMQDLTGAVTWTSSDDGIATVSNAGGSEGLATSVSVGSATITATEPVSGEGDATTLTVTPAELVSIAVTPEDPSIALGTDQAFTAAGTYTDGSMQDLTDAVTWSSSDDGVATISNAGGSEGLASGVSAGTVTITATEPVSGEDGATTLTVTAATLESLAVTHDGYSVPVDGTRQLTATGTYTDGSMQDLTDAVSWSSSADGVATVSNGGGSEGLATAVALGTATVTATHAKSGVDGSATLHVVEDIAFRSASSGSAVGNGDLTLPAPAGVQPGDVLIAAITARPSTTTITPPAGWTLVRRLDNGAGNTSSLAVYRRLAGAGEPADWTWTLSSTTGSAGGIAAFLGVDPAAPVDAENGQSTPSGLTHTAPGVTTSRADAMLVSAHAFSSSAAWTPPAGMTEAVEAASHGVPNASGVSLEISYELQATAGASGDRTATAGTDADTGNAHLTALSP